MAEHQLFVPKTTDGAVIEFFERLAKDHQFQTPIFRIFGLDPEIKMGTTEFQTLQKVNKYFIKNADASKNNFSVSFNRSTDATRFAAPDSIRLTNNNAFPAQFVIQIETLIGQIFFKAAAAESASSTLDDAVSSHLHIATRLEESLERISSRFAEERLSLQKEQDAFIKRKEAEFAKREEALREELTKEKQALAAREKDLDDRTNMHARRSIRQDIKKQLQNYSSNFSLTTATRRMRLSIHLVVGGAIVALGIFDAVFLMQISDWLEAAKAAAQTQSGSPPIGELYALSIKSGAATLVLIGLLAWYIRWLNRWFEQHSEAEFDLKRFELDVDRASWIVETALEWKTTQQSGIPEILMASISRNLFVQRQSESDQKVHPIDYLASTVFGKAARMKIGPGGAELELDRRSIKNIVKEVE